MPLPLLDQAFGETLQACERLTAAFTYLVDHQRYDDLVDLFTEDCLFERPGTTLNGRGELRSFMAARPIDAVSRHFCAPTVLTTATRDTASGITYLVFVEGIKAEAGPATLKAISAVAEYHDEFRRTSQGWRIAHRRVTPVMMHH